MAEAGWGQSFAAKTLLAEIDLLLYNSKMKQETSKSTKYEILLLITAAIWGTGFVAQRLGMNNIGAFSFNAARFFIGSIMLIPLIIIRKAKWQTIKAAIVPGIIAGFIIAVAAGFQQQGLVYTSAGKAGFITGLYVVLVPISAMFFGKKSPTRAWIGVIFAFIGLYLLSFTSIDGINSGDILVFISAFFWTAHILFLDRWSSTVDPIILASIQFFVCAVLCTIGVIFTETPTVANFADAWLSILYGGVFSIGIGYTLQAVAQSKAHPTRASIIMSLESPFAAISGFFFLSEVMGLSEILGCALMLGGSIIAEWPSKLKEKNANKNTCPT